MANVVIVAFGLWDLLLKMGIWTLRLLRVIYSHRGEMP